MADSDEDVPREKHPATWENELVGKAWEVVGKALHKDKIVEEGEEQTEIAREVHEQAKDARDD